MKNNDKKIEKILKFLSIANDLKTTQRWLSLVALKRRESTADHSWRMSLMVMIFTKEIDFRVDSIKVLKMSIIHDLVEAITGDIDHSLVASGIISKKYKVDGEHKAMATIKKSLPEESSSEIAKLWDEFEKAKTPEARFTKAMDRLETMHHYLLSFDLKKNGRKKGYRPDLLAVYGDKALSEFPKLLPILKSLKQKLKLKYKKAGLNWEKEYDAV